MHEHYMQLALEEARALTRTKCRSARSSFLRTA